jgi:hypothetical protein
MSAANQLPPEIRGTARISNAERLSRAVLLLYRGGPWTKADKEEWRELTGSNHASASALCHLARLALDGLTPRPIQSEIPDVLRATERGWSAGNRQRE